MQRFKNILVVTDCDDRSFSAFERAVALALKNQAQLTVVTVLEPLPSELRRLTLTIDSEDLWRIGWDERRVELDCFLDRIRHGLASVASKILSGTPFLEIIREVLRNQHDLVIITAEGGAGEMLFGSTSMHLMRKCPCPVWVVNPAQLTPYARVLAAVDPMADGPALESLNLKIIQLASSLARMGGSELHVIHTWLSLTEQISYFRRLPHAEPESIAATREIHNAALDKLLGQCNLEGIKVQLHLLQGEAGDLIPGVAKEKQIDVIVMGTVGRTGIAGLFIGNTAEKVLNAAHCSVLTLKPEGFVTPVTL